MRSAVSGTSTLAGSQVTVWGAPLSLAHSTVVPTVTVSTSGSNCRCWVKWTSARIVASGLATGEAEGVAPWASWSSAATRLRGIAAAARANADVKRVRRSNGVSSEVDMVRSFATITVTGDQGGTGEHH